MGGASEGGKEETVAGTRSWRDLPSRPYTDEVAIGGHLGDMDLPRSRRSLWQSPSIWLVPRRR